MGPTSVEVKFELERALGDDRIRSRRAVLEDNSRGWCSKAVAVGAAPWYELLEDGIVSAGNNPETHKDAVAGRSCLRMVAAVGAALCDYGRGSWSRMQQQAVLQNAASLAPDYRLSDMMEKL
ncbi:hypothetical protein E2562_037811 [Oryza meyeriana var. granulata]|uniref:Uncharacterized protein n=1 Tax=Oryza meyeriana var. granulata TaxID=110450 RepID=A0A6G1DUA1_9ORYZ|nr:hypothetical protein E2562_037811 [Oryza meyeriana var. granulata]